jgi:hypothetical protein
MGKKQMRTRDKRTRRAIAERVRRKAAQDALLAVILADYKEGGRIGRLPIVQKHEG